MIAPLLQLRPSVRVLPWLLLAPLVSATASLAAECEARSKPKTVPKGAWVVHEENDVLLLKSTDKGYTQGLRLGYGWQPGCEWPWTQAFAEYVEHRLHAENLLFGDPRKLTRRTSFGLGQHIFTPRNLARRDLNENDRPFAGWLYATLRHDYATPEHGTASSNWLTQTQTSLEYQLGFVGEGSLAEAAQKIIHDSITKSQHPNGWDHQLEMEPGLLVRYQWQGRLAHEKRWFDVVPDYSIAAGNVQTYVGAGVTLRAGLNVSGFPTRTLEPSLFGGTNERRCVFSWLAECYVFGHAEGRYFARNIFLDGSTWKDSHRVAKERLVHTWSAGLRLRLVPNNITLNYLYTWRSREFTPVPRDAVSRDGSHEYGALTIHWDTYLD